jgi:two-component system sensor histidine kinase TctE
VDRATTLANQMLSLAKVEQLKQQRAFEVLDWAEVVRALALDMSPLIANKDIDFELATQPCPVLAHDWMLRELVRNLLHNAIRHTPHHSALSMNVAAHAQYAVLTLSDSGPGISDNLRMRLFQPFAVGDSRTGTGLGLTLASEIVLSLGGTISLNNRMQGNKVIGLDAIVNLPLHTSTPN